MITQRRKAKTVQIGDKAIGGQNPVLVQSMCNTKTTDVEKTVKQINDLTKAGCEIIRVAVPNILAAKSLGKIKKQIAIPLVADIHFDYRLALEALEQGVDKLRINPGNIGSKEKTEAVVKVAKNKGVPIRIGVNSGSLPQDILEKNEMQVTPEGMVEAALRHVEILEKLKFKDTIVSLKAPDAPRMIEAYRLFAKETDYPMHLGVTEAGLKFVGTIQSSIGIGTLLAEGIGDTIRVSLTDEPVEEVKVGWEILKSLDLRQRGRKLISCPTCGRTQIDLIKLAKQVEEATRGIKKNIKVAVMGCVVNGPGEAREADIGVTGGRGVGIIFKKDKILKTVPEDKIIETLLEEIEKL
ncbi:flavodoxin-dependent (E)-4-hydroxy-3-methylbut-2-enyl-diphosphate synthase [Patescibacteria group bacterium]|nr:flavodoxin-dependent (E)-4-hydroxy-3-methylbut-2-enyl-diphosphate synthase [Patescibacteria group bacterium]MBU1075469.1 flavodoxin-dependent (E)-4-hydroxy-3-methylbut-2-enyl-diphosphate synthase [Patescibacteria group bacterium]MBU1951574.1 flavodoxin-dependent (E)-4-hydroxy-3-methylbut-2-enyl-diphosphate synthase [Patescibacteria group bacterium]